MRVLIADDDATLRMLIREILQVTLSCEVVEATNGEEAWKLLDAGEQVDICIFDLRMPRLNGIELVNRMRSDDRFAQHKIMVCSGVSERTPIMEAVSAGIDGYLLKPFVGDSLQKQVRKLWEKPIAPPPAKALQPLEQVLKRLGTKPETYVRLLRTFTSDISDVVAILRGAWTPDVRQDSSIRLTGIQSSALSLGAEGIVPRAASLEQSVSKNEVAAKLTKLSALDVENRRIVNSISKLETEVRALETNLFNLLETKPVTTEEAPKSQPEALCLALDFLKKDN